MRQIVICNMYSEVSTLEPVPIIISSSRQHSLMTRCSWSGGRNPCVLVWVQISRLFNFLKTSDSSTMKCEI